MQEIKVINKEIAKLSEKQTWIRSGLEKLIKKINTEMGGNPDISFWYEKDIIYDSDTENQYIWHFSGNWIEIGERNYDMEYSEANVENLDMIVIRRAIETLPNFLSELTEKIQEYNGKYEALERELQKYLEL